MLMEFMRKKSRWIAGVIVAVFVIAMLIPVLDMLFRGGNGTSP